MEAEGSVVSESATQGYRVGSENGQLSGGPFTGVYGSVTPVQRKTENLRSGSMMDGVDETGFSFIELPELEPTIKANSSAHDYGDIVTAMGTSKVMETSKLDGFQAKAVRDREAHTCSLGDGQRQITEPPQSTTECGEDIATREAPEEMFPGSDEAVFETERWHAAPEAVMDLMFSGHVASTFSTFMDEGNSSISSHTIHGNNENFKAADRTTDKTSFHNATLKAMNDHLAPEQQRTNSMLAGSSCEPPVAFEQSTLRQQLIDAMPLSKSKSPKRLLESGTGKSPNKRQRMDAPSKSRSEQDFKSGSSSIKSALKYDTGFTSIGGSSKAGLANTTSAAPPPIPAMSGWSNFTVAILRKELSKRGLPCKGVKTLLVQRLTEHDTTQAAKEAVVEKGDGGPTFAESKSVVTTKGKGVKQISEAPAGTGSGPGKDASAAARCRDRDVENLAAGLVDDAIFGDDAASANLSYGKMARQSYIEHPHDELNETARAGSPANAEVQNDSGWQDDTHEEVLLLTTPIPYSPMAEGSVQQDGDTDISLQSVEAPGIESDAHIGTPPRFTGSGTVWTGGRVAKQS